MMVYFKKSLKLLIAIFVLGLLFIFSTLWYFSSDLPDYKILSSYKPPVSSRVHSGEGQLIAEYALQKRLFIPYDSVPKKVIYSFLSAEDKNFFTHPGIDAKSITRAIIKNLKNIFSEKRLEGASTITQQVAKNFLLTNEVSINRKIKEAIHRTFELDMQKASEHVEQFDDLLTVKEFNQPPLIIKLWQQEEINLESVVILNNIFGFMNNANKDITETISWPDIYRLITKITPFVEYRPDKATTILQSIFYK